MTTSLIASSHHALLFVHSDRKTFTTTLWGELRKKSFAHVLHDVSVLDIETARSLISWANTPYDAEKIAVLSFHSITIPAQNALLKILEEPKTNVRFILVTGNKEALIPTLYSRLQEQEVTSDERDVTQKLANIFLITPSHERMKLSGIVALLTATDEDGRKDREGVRSFVLSLVTILRTESKHAHHIPTVVEMASYAGDPSSSGKTIIEYLALLLPELKS